MNKVYLPPLKDKPKPQMKLLLLIFCMGIFFLKPLHAQETKEITNSESGEIYEVLKSNKKIRHGKYEKKGIKKLYVKGQYTNGERSGIWEFSNIDGKLLSKYDFDARKLVLYNIKNETKPLKKLIAVDTLTRPAIYIGGNDYILSGMAKAMRYPPEARSNQITGKVVVSFTVTRDGEATHFHVKKPLGYGLDEEAIRVLKLNPNLWLPALLDGEPVDSEFNYLVVYHLQNQPTVISGSGR